jgi:hypothetical protein
MGIVAPGSIGHYLDPVHYVETRLALDMAFL